MNTAGVIVFFFADVVLFILICDSLDIVTESQMMAQTLAKRDLAKKKLAVSYFSLIMDLESGQNQHK